MTDAEYAVQKARVQRLIDRWVKPLGLGWWSWEYIFYRGPIPSEKTALFLISVRFEYGDATMSINAESVAEIDDEELERAWAHEMGHVFTLPLKDAVGRDITGSQLAFLEEHQATAIGKSLQWLRAAVEPERGAFPLDEY